MGCAKTCWIYDISGLLPGSETERSISQHIDTEYMHTMHTCSQTTTEVSAKMFVSLHEGQNNIIVSVCVCVCLCFCLYLCVRTRPSLSGERFKLN